MKKQIALMLCFVMLVGLFTGCSNTATLTGKWQGQIDMSEFFTEQFSQADAIYAESFTFTDINLSVYMVFNEDGTGEFYMDESQYAQLGQKLLEQMMPTLIAQLEEMSGMSYEELLTMYNITEDEFTQMLEKELLSGFDAAELSHKFLYKSENGMLYICDPDESLEDDPAGNPYSISGDSLTIEVAKDNTSPWLSIVFKKVS